MGVKSLGYVVVETAKPEKWEHFLTELVGAMRTTGAADSAALYRIDDRLFRFRIQSGDTERLVAAGYEMGSADELSTLAEALSAGGHPVSWANEDEALARGALGLLRTCDPTGNGLEFYHGDKKLAEPFVSPIGVEGFVTGDIGMGHAVFAAPNFEETYRFYKDVIGLGDTDLPVFHLMGPENPPMHFAFMHGENGRHHCLALGESPVPPSGCVHLMVELPNLIEVGKAYDRMRVHGYPESASLGRHVNDEMTSFYVQTPSGFDLEIGCDGLVIDPGTWETTRHEQISVWGHLWAWQKAMAEQEAK
ncbi:VOC family protein [Novosphingobium panipatense]|uniref:3,4-dihydroxy-9,10-secoandrosta-1,3,5(10)-triene-9,17-dione 4,5-dioxygenase n=1 Tax=Novosphingobium panipatense TaxID=428991 RepID=A0ABY1Q6X9_9SPHN|nr:VOC family protein [Novosphingobium panipatense]SMP60705.1 3,4-dihydroxy-9,10-secoandrosta-1,3,5(10)-triene-9,17-dione 4,5-dioxygenase [Novosphingobium panipatense]